MAKTISPKSPIIIVLCTLALFVPLVAFTGQQGDGGRIVGRVIGRETGHTLAAEISIAIRARSGITMKHVDVSEQGQFEIAGLPPGEMHLTTKLAGYAVEHQSFSLGEGETRQIEFRLVKSGTVRGIINDPAGNPLGDAQIRVIYAEEASARGALAATYQWEMGEVRSDTNGGFAVEVHPEKEFIVETSHPGFVGEVSSPMRLASAEGRAPLKISLARGGSFEGEVKDENGDPVAGAQVRLMEAEERAELQRFASFELLKRRARMAVSGADGRFRFDQVDTSNKVLIITHPKYRSARRAVELNSDREQAPVTVTLKGKNDR